MANGGPAGEAAGAVAHDGATAAAVESRLLVILDMVNDWLKFAEAKNAGLVVLVGTGITAILTFLTADRNPPRAIELGLIWAEIFLSLSLLLAIYSFLPKLLPFVDGGSEPADGQPAANFYFFGDLARFASTDTLVAAVAGDAAAHRPSASDRYLANQIISNARIVSRKFRLFTMSAYLAYVAVAPVPVVLLIALVDSFFD